MANTLWNDMYNWNTEALVGGRETWVQITYIGKSELYRIRFFGLLLTHLLCQSKSHSIQLIFFLKIPSQDLYNLGNETSIGHIRYDVVVYVQKQLAVNDG